MFVELAWTTTTLAILGAGCPRTSYGVGARAPLFGNGPRLFGARVALRDASAEPQRSHRSSQVDARDVHMKGFGRNMFFRCLHSNTQVDILIVLRAAIEVPTEMPTSPAMDIGEAGSAGLGVRCFRKSPVRIGLCSTSQSLFNDLFRDRERRAISRKMMNSTNKYTHYSAPTEVLEDSV